MQQPTLVTTVQELRAATDGWRRAGLVVGVVPTMGALHEGHLALVRRLQEQVDRVVVTIFVNPTQFAAGEDLDRYPHDLPGDMVKCREVGVHAVFAPASSEIYPKGECTRVTVPDLSGTLCGMSRPTHFQGVATVVTKLLSAVGPCVAIFGRKDFQQLRVIERLATDLLLPVTIVSGPIVRERDGLALSSRNAYLTPEMRPRALGLVRGLSRAVRAFQAGERTPSSLLGLARESLEQAELKVDYVSLVDAVTLQPVERPQLQVPALLAVAAWLGQTRLIDNVVLGEDGDPLATPRETGALVE